MVLGSAVVGLLVGMTGAGGGALMTPMLILVFGVKPSAAISSDLVASVLMRPVGAAVHLYRGTVNGRLVGWTAAGSVPAALLGTLFSRLLGTSSAGEVWVERSLGTALLAGALAMLVRALIDRRSGRPRVAGVRQLQLRPAATVTIGAVGGIVVGMTSVGSGSLLIVLLLFVYPTIGASQLVGTDLCQAVPLTLAAALGALVLGHVELAVTSSVALGSVPAVLLGALLSSRAPERCIRPVLSLTIFASGLKYVGLGTPELGWAIGGAVLVAAAWRALGRPGTTASAPMEQAEVRRSDGRVDARGAGVCDVLGPGDAVPVALLVPPARVGEPAGRRAPRSRSGRARSG